MEGRRDVPNGCMVSNGTNGIRATSTWPTRIDTLVVEAGFVQGTVVVDRAFGLTAHVGISKVFWEANTSSSSVPFFTSCIGPTWIGCTGLGPSGRGRRRWELTSHESIPNVSLETDTRKYNHILHLLIYLYAEFFGERWKELIELLFKKSCVFTN